MRTLIFITLDGMGDIAIFWPIWREIARQSPDGKVSFLMAPSAGNAQNILKRQEWVEDIELFQTHKGTRGLSAKGIGKYFSIFNHVRKNKFSSIWMFRDGFKYYLPFYLGGARHIYGMSDRTPSFLFENKPRVKSNPPIQCYERYLRFSECFGEHTLSFDNLTIPVLDRPMKLKKPYITLGIGGASYAQYKRWPVSYWASLIQKISEIDRTLDIHLVAGTSEISDMDEIMKILPHLKEKIIPQINLDIEDLLYLLKHSSYTVANDTGVLNFSGRVGTKTYGMYGRHSFKAYENPNTIDYMIGFNPQITPIHVDPSLPFDVNTTEMDKITPDQVIKAIYQEQST